MQEPPLLMRWVMFHFAGGDALIAGLVVIFLVSFLPESPKSAWRWSLVTLLAAIWSGLSSPAWAWYWLLGISSLLGCWRVGMHRWGCRSPAVRRMSAGVQIVLIIVVVLETGLMSRSSARSDLDTLGVIADSITAGLNDGEVTWPRLLAEQAGLTVQDASQPGATWKSALRQADLLYDEKSPLILEIGGNDLLSGVTVADFTRDCEALCVKVCTPGRVVWMCELPLPPFSSRYGVAQRSVCRRHGVQLIPKRKLMRLLTTAGSTVDSIHLSPRGQELFLELVKSQLHLEHRSSKENGSYQRCEPGRIDKD